MTNARFLQVHSLHSYPAALINRDDSGLAKRMPFGNAIRTRISSQCLKRHWRMAESEHAFRDMTDAQSAIRSRNIVERSVMGGLRAEAVAIEEVLDAVEEALNVGIYGEKGASRDDRQTLLLGLPEVEYLQKKARAICGEYPEDAVAAGQAATGLLVTDERIRRATGATKSNLRTARGAAEILFGKDEHKNFEVFRKNTKLPGGIESALFGRMMTSDPGANIDAAVHVAHAFTVHQEESESDYFSVVDDLQTNDEDAGAAYIGDTELTAGLFYGYVVVDLPGLVSNLDGCEANDWIDADRELAADVVERLVHLIATVSPGAKRGSTAPYSYADLMLVEAGSRQPRSLANAFRNPVAPQLTDSVSALGAHLDRLDAAYGAHELRRWMSVDDFGAFEAERVNLDALAAWAASVVRNGDAS